MSNPTMNRIFAHIGQIIFFALFAVILMTFSNSPPYEHFSHDNALIKISISHSGQIKGKCSKRSADELAKLSPNMRVSEICPRERSSIQLDLEVDGKLIFSNSVRPSGIQRDGIASIYERLTVPIGKHHLVVRMKDHEKLADYNYVKQMDVSLAPGQVFVIDFESEAGGFIFR